MEQQQVAEIIKAWSIREFYHYTAGANITSIRQNRGLYALSEHPKHSIRCNPFLSSESSRKTDEKYGIHGFVRLSFVRDHAMLPDARSRTTDGRILRLIISSAVLSTPGTRFTPEFASQLMGKTYPIEELEERLDLGVVYGSREHTRRTTNWTYGKARRAEILVPLHVPNSMILSYEWI